MTSPLKTAAEVAAHLRTDPIVIVRACRAGHLEATKPHGRWLISDEAVEAYKAKHSNRRDAA